MRNEPRILADAELLRISTDPQEIADRVARSYREVGCSLDGEMEAALLVDPLCSDCPMVGISSGFERLTGFSRDQLLGQNCRFMLHGVPKVAVSRSVRKNMRDFCRMCRLAGLMQIAEVMSLQPNARWDGSHFMNLFVVGLCTVGTHPYILGVQISVGEGLLAKLPSDRLQHIMEERRLVFQRLRARFSKGAILDPRGGPRLKPRVGGPEFAFFGARLQDHCMLLNDGYTVMRREPQELATNCLVIGDRPVERRERGLCFSLRVDDVVTTFEGWPLLGFTRRHPMDAPDLYPTVARCFGESVLIGSLGEAFARDKHEHFQMRFRPPPPTEVEVFCTDPGLDPHSRRPPAPLRSGDRLDCIYTHEGQLQLVQNGKLILDFDVKRPIEKGKDYYAVADNCFSACSLTLLPFAEDRSVPRSPNRELNGQDIDGMVTSAATGALVEKAICSVCAGCRFCVSVGDPSKEDVPLIAVSESFGMMTGYQKSEIIGMNCRFLNQGCPVSPMDLMGLRVASRTGAPFTALLPNRKKCGEMFINLLDLRGIVVAHDVRTQQKIWYLIGIQADVTGLAGDGIPENHFAELQEAAAMIREHLRHELSRLASQSAEAYDLEVTPELRREIRLLEEPVWLTGCEQDLGRLAHAPEATLAPCPTQPAHTLPQPSGAAGTAGSSVAGGDAAAGTSYNARVTARAGSAAIFQTLIDRHYGDTTDQHLVEDPSRIRHAIAGNHCGDVGAGARLHHQADAGQAPAANSQAEPAKANGGSFLSFNSTILVAALCAFGMGMLIGRRQM